MLMCIYIYVYYNKARGATFWPSLVAKDQDILIEQSLTLIEMSFTLIEQSSLSFLIVSKCSGVNVVRSVAADLDSCGMGRIAKAGGYDLFFGFI